MRWIFDLHHNVDRESDIIGLTYKVKCSMQHNWLVDGSE